MKDHEFAQLFASASACLGLGVSAFLLMSGIAVAGVQASSFFAQEGGGRNVAAAAVALPDDYGTGVSPIGVYCPQLSITLQKGSRDASTEGQVSELQNFLTDYYNLDENIVVGGFFGNVTQKYVTQFQQEQGLPSLGIVGSLTRSAIAKACNAPAATAKVAISASAAAASSSLADILQFQSSGASKMCTVPSQNSGVTVYVAYNKIVSVSKSGVNYLLIDGGYVYLWSTATSSVYKTALNSGDFVSTVKSYSCTDWTPNTAIFQLPANAQISDATAVTAAASLASTRGSITLARGAYDPSTFAKLGTLVQQVRASTRTDIPNLKAFAATWGDSVLSFNGQYQVLGQVQIDNLSSSDLDVLFTKYMALRTERDQILAAYNTIPPSESSQFIPGTPNVTTPPTPASNVQPSYAAPLATTTGLATIQVVTGAPFTVQISGQYNVLGFCNKNISYNLTYGDGQHDIFISNSCAPASYTETHTYAPGTYAADINLYQVVDGNWNYFIQAEVLVTVSTSGIITTKIIDPFSGTKG